MNPDEQKPGAAAWLAVGAAILWRATRSAATTLQRWLYAPTQPRPAMVENSPKSGERKKDRNLTLEMERHLAARRRLGTFLIACSFAASFAGGFGFLEAYWTGASNQALGGWMALLMFGWGAGFIFWSHLLTVHKEAADPRESMTPPPEEREPTVEDFCAGAGDLHRRGLLKWLSACSLGLFAALFVSLFKSFGFNPGEALFTEVWKHGQRLMTEDGRPVRADSLEPGNTTIVFPEGSIGSERAQTVLVRVDKQLLELPGDRSDWAPGGYLAYSRVCTHAGCSVGMYLRTVHILMCPCHQSTFDVLKAAEPTGGPADRPLPQLPLYVDSEGVLRAAGGFSGAPGPGFWGIPS
jgi:ubiquinol-cytochrome c reductase iron-sulfur subunit